MKPSQRKIVLVFVCFLILLAIIVARLFEVQILEHAHYVAMARDQQVFIANLPAKRGTIYDRNLRPLAMTLPSYEVFADPQMIGDPKGAAVLLAQFGLGDLKALCAKLTKDSRFVWLDRRLGLEASLDLKQELKDHKLNAVYLEPAGERNRPLADLAVNVLGRVSIDDEPQGGIEQSYDNDLRGKHGLRRFFRDALGAQRPCVEASVSTPVCGQSIVLTIDADLQEVAEHELDLAVEEHKAKGGCVIVVDPRTGDVLAIASNPRDADFPVTHVYEPGSAFKLCTIATALDLGKVDTTTVFDTNGGCLPLPGGKPIKDDHPGGVMDLREAVRRSSNVVAALVARRIGERAFYKYLLTFGFGSKTGIGLEGESKGLLKNPENEKERWSSRSLETMGMGQEIGVTAMQMAMAYAAVANGGTLYKPRLVEAVVDDDCNVIRTFPPKAVRTVVKKETSEKMAVLLRRVVEKGTGTQAKIKGVEIAGKTGTAQKAVNGMYVKGKYTSTFAGYLPASDPTLVCVVVIDEPTANGYYAAVVSAPVFKSLVEYTLKRDKTSLPSQCYDLKPRDQEPADKHAQTVAASTADARKKKGQAAKQVAREEEKQPQGSVYPCVVGLTLKEAAEVLAKSQIRWCASGSGVVVEQVPGAQSPLDETRLCKLVLGATE